jgi:hypothetical protein
VPIPLAQQLLHEVADAIVELGLALNRATLIGGIDARIVAAIPQAPTPQAQILNDLQALNAHERLADGSAPLEIYLQTARYLAGQRVEAAKLEAALLEARRVAEPRLSLPSPRSKLPIAALIAAIAAAIAAVVLMIPKTPAPVIATPDAAPAPHQTPNPEPQKPEVVVTRLEVRGWQKDQVLTPVLQQWFRGLEKCYEQNYPSSPEPMIVSLSVLGAEINASTDHNNEQARAFARCATAEARKLTWPHAASLVGGIITAKIARK